MSLATEYRPQDFSEVVGQRHIVNVLSAAIKSGRLPSSLLFCGTRGTGKTSMARIVAKALNCTSTGSRPCNDCENCKSINGGTYSYVREIDTASHRGIDDIRKIAEYVRFAPPKGTYSIWIMDECHRLTGEAADAFLKVLEEPPENTIFILCTTEEQSLIQTIRSRCMKLNFKHLTSDELRQRLVRILDDNKLTYDMSALQLVVNAAKGSMRDAITLLESCLHSGHLSQKNVAEMLSVVDTGSIVELFERICQQNRQQYLTMALDLIVKTSDPVMVKEASGRYIHDLMLVNAGCSDLIYEADEVKATMKKHVETFGKYGLLALLEFWEARIYRSYEDRTSVEIFMMMLFETAVKKMIDNEVLDLLLKGLEDKISIVERLPHSARIKTDKAEISIVTKAEIATGYYILYDEAKRAVMAGGNFQNVKVRKTTDAN